jgi:hypothetical protein
MPDLPDYRKVADELNAHWDDQGGAAFRTALQKLSALASRADLDAAEFLAEILALRGPHHDAASAYKWYFIVLSQQGCSVGFQDKNHIPPAYCGPVGDFRNESMVSELVSELGFALVAELDLEAQAWLLARGLEFCLFRPEST